MQPDFFDNRAKVLKDDLVANIHEGDRLSVAASVFSMYAYRELREQLEGLESFRFIYTSPAFLSAMPKSSGSSTSRVLTASAAWAAPSLRSV